LHCKLHTHPLVRESALHEEEIEVIAKHKKIKIWSWTSKDGPTPRRTGRLTIGRKKKKFNQSVF
jgi:hypothetical protein